VKAYENEERWTTQRRELTTKPTWCRARSSMAGFANRPARGSNDMEIGRMLVGELHTLQRDHIVWIIWDRDALSALVSIADHFGNVGKHWLAELQRIRSRLEIVDRIRTKSGRNANAAAPAPPKSYHSARRWAS
jgi:hypothetical protein